jgi:hypothetical protein
MAHNSAKNSAKNRVRMYQSASSSEYLVVDRTDPKPPPAIAGWLLYFVPLVHRASYGAR